jgi:hypothetical protein
MELRASWEAANFTATQEISSILWNPKIYYHFHKSFLLVPILSQIDPGHPIPSYLSMRSKPYIILDWGQAVILLRLIFLAFHVDYENV